MMKINKKMGGLFVVSALVMAMSTAVFADTDAATNTTTVNDSKTKRNGTMKGMHGKDMPMQNIEKAAAEKGITIDEFKEQMEKQREEKLAKIAAEKGITVDELKAQREKEREAKLTKLAADKGITVDELKAQMQKQGRADRGGFRLK